MEKFADIHARAARRKGGVEALDSILPRPLSAQLLARKSDAACLSMMSRCVFRAGFSWKVIDKKWSGFEKAFYGFRPAVLVALPAETWDACLRDTRIVRSWQKIKTVYENAQFVLDTSAIHGSFGKFLCSWPCTDQVGLMRYLRQHGARLGGNTGQYFLRFIGKDAFVLTADVVLALQNAGVDISDNPVGKRDLARVQAAFNAWREESGLGYAQISKIAACSCGVNHEIEIMRRESHDISRSPA